MEYPAAIKYILELKQVADIQSRICCHAVDNLVPTNLARCVNLFVCPITDIYRVEVRVQKLAKQRAYVTGGQICQLLKQEKLPDVADIELYPLIEQYLNV